MVETRNSLLFVGHVEPFLQRAADTLRLSQVTESILHSDMYLVSHPVTLQLVRHSKEIKYLLRR